MRDRRPVIEAVPLAGEDTRYCVLCDTVVLFERIGAEPPDDDAEGGEWICVRCGSAVYVDPPVQAFPDSLRRTA